MQLKVLKELKVNNKAYKMAFDLMYYFIMAILIIAIISGVLFNISYKIEGKKVILGYSPTLVVSGSMLPTIQINAMCIMRTVSIDDIKIGDIVVYRNDFRGINVVHRVVNIVEEDGEKALVMKGDNNSYEDQIHPKSSDIVGKVVWIVNSFANVANGIIQKGKISHLRLGMVCAEGILLLYVTTFAVVYIVSKLIGNFKKSGGNYDGRKDDDDNGRDDDGKWSDKDGGYEDDK